MDQAGAAPGAAGTACPRKRAAAGLSPWGARAVPTPTGPAAALATQDRHPVRTCVGLSSEILPWESPVVSSGRFTLTGPLLCGHEELEGSAEPLFLTSYKSILEIGAMEPSACAVMRRPLYDGARQWAPPQAFSLTAVRGHAFKFTVETETPVSLRLKCCSS